MNYEELLGTTRNYEVGVENPTTDELSDAAVQPANPARSGGASLGGGASRKRPVASSGWRDTITKESSATAVAPRECLEPPPCGGCRRESQA